MREHIKMVTVFKSGTELSGIWTWSLRFHNYGNINVYCVSHPDSAFCHGTPRKLLQDNTCFPLPGYRHAYMKTWQLKLKLLQFSWVFGGKKAPGQKPTGWEYWREKNHTSPFPATSLVTALTDFYWLTSSWQNSKNDNSDDSNCGCVEEYKNCRHLIYLQRSLIKDTLIDPLDCKKDLLI